MCCSAAPLFSRLSSLRRDEKRKKRNVNCSKSEATPVWVHGTGSGAGTDGGKEAQQGGSCVGAAGLEPRLRPKRPGLQLLATAPAGLRLPPPALQSEAAAPGSMEAPGAAVRRRPRPASMPHFPAQLRHPACGYMRVEAPEGCVRGLLAVGMDLLVGSPVWEFLFLSFLSL